MNRCRQMVVNWLQKCSHELEVELEVEVKEEVKYIVEIIDFLNNRCGTNYKSTTKKNRD